MKVKAFGPESSGALLFWAETSAETIENREFRARHFIGLPLLQPHILCDNKHQEMAARDGPSRDVSQRLALFTWRPNEDVLKLVPLMDPSVSVHYITYIEKEWRSCVDRYSDVILCEPYVPQSPPLTHLKEFLDYCKVKDDPKNVTVVLIGVEDGHSKRKIRDWWTGSGYSDYELLTPSNAELQKLIDRDINLLSAERRMANKAGHMHHMHHMHQEAAEKKTLQKTSKFTGKNRGTLGIFSRSPSDEYSWLEAMLKAKFTVKCFYIFNNGLRQFMEDVSQCRFGILYHSKNRGRINVTDVTGSLYDDELEYMSTMLGKQKVWVVIDDLSDNSEKAKREILHYQPKIQRLANDLYLIKHGTAEKKVRDLELNKHPFT